VRKPRSHRPKGESCGRRLESLPFTSSNTCPNVTLCSGVTGRKRARKEYSASGDDADGFDRSEGVSRGGGADAANKKKGKGGGFQSLGLSEAVLGGVLKMGASTVRALWCVRTRAVDWRSNSHYNHA